MTIPAIGHNNPPDPIDAATAPYMAAIEEAENWLDGTQIENEGQMRAVDVLIAELRKAKSDLSKAKKSATAPLHDAWKAELARWRPAEDDLENRLKGLVTIVGPFKRKLASEREAAARVAEQEAWRKGQAAHAAVADVNKAVYETQRAADRAIADAAGAKATANAASADKVKGLRKTTKYEITDHRAALHWIARNDPDAMTAFVQDYVRRTHKTAQIDGVRVWQEREAF